MAPVISATEWKKGVPSETSHSLSKPTALSKELQAQSCNPNQAGHKDDLHLSSTSFRIETKNQNQNR